jgi:hypothetical protein
MKSDGMDAYDVAAIAEKVGREERAARQRHIADIVRDLRSEFRREVMEVRQECAELIADGFTRMARTSVEQDNELNALRRMVDERTGHLA